jgi:MFS family permease
VLSRIKDKNIWTVYGAILVLGIAYGISIALIAHHLDVRGFNKPQMGTLASWFALGIVAFSLPMGAMIRACSVGIWVSCETILLARAERGMKAYVTTLYAVSIAIGYVVGPLAAHAIVGVATIQRAFLVSGALAALATVIVVVWLDRDGPELAHETRPLEAGAGSHLAAVMLRIKTSCFATFAYGYFQASVVLFLPLYLMEAKGTPRSDTILIPFYFALGMLLFSNAAGRYGDRFGHLLVMRLLAVIGTCMIIGFIFLKSYAFMAGAVFIAGASLAAISPVSLALQGVVTAPADYSRSNSVYNAFYAAGMLLGPKVSSVLFATYGGGVMLAHLASLWTAFVIFTVVFAADDPAASSERVVGLGETLQVVEAVKE